MDGEFVNLVEQYIQFFERAAESPKVREVRSSIQQFISKYRAQPPRTLEGNWLKEVGELPAFDAVTGPELKKRLARRKPAGAKASRKRPQWKADVTKTAKQDPRKWAGKGKRK